MKLFIKAIAMVGLTATAMSSNATGLFDRVTAKVGLSTLQTTDLELINNWGGYVVSGGVAATKQISGASVTLGVDASQQLAKDRGDAMPLHSTNNLDKYVGVVIPAKAGLIKSLRFSWNNEAPVTNQDTSTGATNGASYQTYKMGVGAAVNKFDADASVVMGSQAADSNPSQRYSGYSLTLSHKLPKGMVKALFNELSFEQSGYIQAYGVAYDVLAGPGTLQLSYLENKDGLAGVYSYDIGPRIGVSYTLEAGSGAENTSKA